ncbi:MAG: non-hydrolyzing UDP-N-acetylglucosamine 2-epimerase [Candidatus Cyclobacteriaceae bacterium M2_1C_046]
MKKIISIIGARPQFIKYAPLSLELQGKCEDISIHSGQHYDKEMSDIFFEELKIPEPRYFLESGSGSHGVQTGKMLVQLDPILLEEMPDAVIVFGDTNTTVAGALSAAKLNIPLIHIEAGLRSFNREMPEELNRIATDHLSNLLFAPTDEAVENLKKEGIAKNIEKTGDLMADSLRIATEYIKEKDLPNPFNTPYYLATIHRNYNTDNIERLLEIVKRLNDLDHPVIFPMHPRTRILLEKNNIDITDYKNLEITKPLGYFSFINAMYHASAVITDSGGIQKEAYMLKKPCITLRYETEWVETLEGNWNILAGNKLDKIQEYLKKEKGQYHEDVYGDGYAGKQIAERVLSFLE